MAISLPPSVLASPQTRVYPPHEQPVVDIAQGVRHEGRSFIVPPLAIHNELILMVPVSQHGAHARAAGSQQSQEGAPAVTFDGTCVLLTTGSLGQHMKAVPESLPVLPSLPTLGAGGQQRQTLRGWTQPVPSAPSPPIA